MKYIGKPVFLWMLVFVLIATGCNAFGGGSERSKGLNWQVSDFNYINQDGEALGRSDLEGQVWLADFIFTNCETVCPPMTAQMANIQKAMKEQGLNTPILSFSVDPEADSPEKLKEFGEKFDADFSHWHFLTGYTQDEIITFAKESFKTLVQDDPSSDQVVHGTSFYLVDGTGTVIKKYDGLQAPIEQIMEDIETYSDK